MASPTPAPTNIFYIQDEYSAATGGGSGLAMSPDFVATSVANATTVAAIFATLFQTPVRLVNKFNNAAGAFGVNAGFATTLVSPGPANVANTSTPSGTIMAGSAA